MFWKKLAYTKRSKKCQYFFGLFLSIKNHNDSQKVAQLAKNHPIWSPWMLILHNSSSSSQPFKMNVWHRTNGIRALIVGAKSHGRHKSKLDYKWCHELFPNEIIPNIKIPNFGGIFFGIIFPLTYLSPFSPHLASSPSPSLIWGKMARLGEGKSIGILSWLNLTFGHPSTSLVPSPSPSLVPFPLT